MRNTIIGLAAAWVLGAAGVGQAQQISIVNPGFEANFAPGGGFPVLDPAGWTHYDPGGIVNQNNNAVGVLNPAGTTFFADPVPEGSNVALIYLEQRRGTTLPGDPVGLVQTLTGSTLQLNTRYTLSAWVGNIASGSGLGVPYASFGFADLSGFPGYRVELLAGGQVVAADDNTLSIGEGRFALSTVQLVVGASHVRAGQTLGIRLLNLNATGNTAERAREVDFDAVSLIASAVPEPGQPAMLLGGLALLLAAAWRGRRAVRTAALA